MLRKAIIGGTFDPIHNGHLHIAYEALYRLNLDKVIFLPNGNPPHKLNKNILDAELRYDMIKSSIKGEKCFEVSDYEIKNKSVNYTYKTLEYFNKTEPNTSWYFICGADCLMELDTWREVKRIFELCTFTVFMRSIASKEEILTQKHMLENKYGGNILFLEIPLLDISSTYIKEQVKLNRDISRFVNKDVKEIILRNEFYKF